MDDDEEADLYRYINFLRVCNMLVTLTDVINYQMEILVSISI